MESFSGHHSGRHWVTFGSSWGHFRVIMGSFSGHHGIIFRSSWGRFLGYHGVIFGVILGLIWNRFDVILGSLWLKSKSNLKSRYIQKFNNDHTYRLSVLYFQQAGQCSAAEVASCESGTTLLKAFASGALGAVSVTLDVA